MIKMIAFDLFGVVITEAHMVSVTLMPLLPEGCSKRRVKDVYNLYTLGEITEDDFWHGIGQRNNSSLRDTFLNTFELDTDLTDVVKALSPRYSLSILSNLAQDWGESLVKKFQFEASFSPIIMSGEVGCGKPDKRIYEVLIEQISLPAEQILFIDDRLENLATAHALGITTVHYQREADDFDYQPDHCIKQLNEILTLL